MRHFRCVSCTLFFALVSTLYVHGQADECATSATTASDLSLRLSLKNGQTVFREGETITLTVEYSTVTAKKYYLATRNYDRSGRLSGLEVFCIDPANGIDPLADYYNGAMAFVGGGLGGEFELDNKPYAISLELNEWQSLAPGSYRLSIISHRISISGQSNREQSASPLLAMRSNEVEFQVIKADADWQAAQLSVVKSALDSSNASSEDAKHAARVLRFLGSEASTRELARRFSSGNDQPFGWDMKFGLFGSPYRATAISAMKAALTDPRHPITREFAQTLALLELQSDPKSRLPEYDESNREAWGKARDAYMAAFNKQIAAHMAEAVSALQNKTGKARAITVSESLQSDGVLNPDDKTQLRQILIASWDSLPIRQKNELIQYRWEQVGGLEWLPVLRSIVSGEPNRNREINKLDRAPALLRIYELAPDEGRKLILQEIANPKGDIAIDVLGLLSERELPEIEQSLIAKLEAHNDSDLDFQLLERYASVRALPRIKTIYEAHRGEWACSPQSALLRYFLRVRPDYGDAQVNDALSQRAVTGCYQYQLTGLNEYLHRPKLEQIAIRALNDPSLAMATNAAEALEKYGSEQAQAALLGRLEKFHDRWKNNVDKLRYQPSIKPDVQAEMRLEQVLVQAIANGRAWFVSKETIQKVRDLASPQMQPELDGIMQEIQRNDYGLNLNWWPQGRLNYSIGRYSGTGMAALKEKLAQLPTGAHLSLVTTSAEHDQHLKDFTEVEDTAAANGLSLQIQMAR